MKAVADEKRPAQIRLLLKLYSLQTNGADPDKAAALRQAEKSLDPSILKRYLKLKERKGTAVAVLKDGVCSGCNMTYPDSHDVVRYENFIHTCEFCGRFLLIEDEAG